MTTELQSNRQRTFRYKAPEAHSVLLAGDFTNWQKEAIPMQKRDGGQWMTTINLLPGEHHYRFIVDGEWRDDPQCTLRAPNPFGSQDMVANIA